MAGHIDQIRSIDVDALHTMTGWDERWADELAEHCTACGSPPGELCVYLPVAGVDPDFVRFRSERVQARMALVGTPTKRPHNARYNTACIRQLRRHQLLERQRQAALNAPKPVSADTLDAMRALNIDAGEVIGMVAGLYEINHRVWDLLDPIAYTPAGAHTNGI